MGLATLTVVLLLGFAVNLLPSENVTAQQTSPFPSREKVISVTGTANTSVEPDLLVIRLGVETQKITAKEALESNSELTSSVISAVKNVGITEDELSTSRLNIMPLYDSYRDKETGQYTQELLGYRVSNILMIETGNLDSAADIIDGAVSAGVNKIDSVYFTLSPQKQLEVKDDLIENAILNAKTKAENALSPLNHKIIGVKAIYLSEFGIPQPSYISDGFDMAIAESAVMKSSTPVFSSDQDVSTTASVIFLIGSN